MTQSNVSALAPAPDTAVPQGDTIQKMIADIATDRSRLRATPPTDVAGVVREMRETFFEYLSDLAVEVQRQRDWSVTTIVDIDERIEELEGGGGTQLLPEDAEKFKALAEGVDFIIAQVTSLATNLSPEVASQFSKLKELAGECLAIIEDTTLEEEEEPEPAQAATGT